ncbi:MAG: alpha/beta hydrolase [Pseudomonadota bacterium]
MSFAQQKRFHLPPALEYYPVIIVPGLRNSDEHHWQSLWQAKLPNSKRIELDTWDTPNLEKWSAAIIKILAELNQPAVLIAHSFGTLASASVAEKFPEKIAALLLVAPADPDKFSIAHQLPQSPLSPPTKIIASSNDPWMSDNKAAYWALQWSADFLRLNNAGHINSESNLGMWPEGVQELHQLVRRAKRSEREFLGASQAA